MSRIAAPALVAMLMVVGFVAAAGYNAASDPRLSIVVTERELPLALTVASEGDDPGVHLQIAYQGRYDPLDSRNWIGDARLREIGFALQVPVGSPQAIAAYDRVPPRLAWVVFEYDGPAWREVARREELRAGLTAGMPIHLRSRLVPVDAGADFDALRQRYPSGHLIMRAVIGLSYQADASSGRLVHGTLRAIVPERIAVPKRLRATVDQLSADSAGTDPRYEADLAIGALGVPYLRALRLRH